MRQLCTLAVLSLVLFALSAGAALASSPARGPRPPIVVQPAAPGAPPPAAAVAPAPTPVIAQPATPTAKPAVRPHR